MRLKCASLGRRGAQTSQSKPDLKAGTREREDPLALIRLVSNQQRSLFDKLGSMNVVLDEAITTLSERLEAMEAKLGAVHCALAPAGDVELRLAELRTDLEAISNRTSERERSAGEEVAAHRQAIVSALQALGSPPPLRPSPTSLESRGAVPAVPLLPKRSTTPPKGPPPPEPGCRSSGKKEALPSIGAREGGIRRARC